MQVISKQYQNEPHILACYLWSVFITVWIHTKCSGGSYNLSKIASTRKYTTSTTYCKGNSKIITFVMDKGQPQWCYFWIIWFSKLFKIVLNIKILYQMLFFCILLVVTFAFNVELVYAIHVILYDITFRWRKFWLESDFTYVVTFFVL